MKEQIIEEIKYHELKTWPPYFEEVLNGNKTFEVRKDDRGFKVGDVLVLKEWKPLGYSSVSPSQMTGSYTGREVKKKVSYILKGEYHPHFGLHADVVVLGLSDLEASSAIMEVRNGEKWVKVSDRLPPEGKIVLVCPKDNEHCLISMAELQKGVWYNADWFKNMPLDAYPFWMSLPPLPTPPTQQESNA